MFLLKKGEVENVKFPSKIHHCSCCLCGFDCCSSYCRLDFGQADGATDMRSGITQDERRAKALAKAKLIEHPLLVDHLEKFEEKWSRFLSEKVRYDKPQIIADEFLKRWKEL